MILRSWTSPTENLSHKNAQKLTKNLQNISYIKQLLLRFRFFVSYLCIKPESLAQICIFLLIKQRRIRWKILKFQGKERSGEKSGAQIPTNKSSFQAGWPGTYIHNGRMFSCHNCGTKYTFLIDRSSHRAVNPVWKGRFQVFNFKRDFVA